MYYPEELVEEVRMKNDIVDVVSGYVKLQKKGSSHFGLCPFHNEKSPSFSVSGPKQMYYCFGCGAGGNVFTFVMNYENISFREAIKLIADKAGIDVNINVSQNNILNKNTELYEMRVSVGTNEYRTVLFAIDHDNIIQSTRIILLNGFLKKSEKDYRKQINIAEKILKDLEL